VDVLTMTATPIPRTLNLSMLGLRDISTLATPPVDRQDVYTEVCTFDPGRIRLILMRELDRKGQVYFVHNRVLDIEAWREKLQDLVPEARIVVGHGQMAEGELERAMLAFTRHEADILLCTTIIESGIDNPRANTIVIDRSDLFGLADLHQLRGRVGRSKVKAYAYFIVPESGPTNPAAAKRIHAIEEFSQLGSGFKIAMRDLEIRGAGNVLGAEQSGHIAAVGYELYCELLRRAAGAGQGLPHGLSGMACLLLAAPRDQPRIRLALRSVAAVAAGGGVVAQSAVVRAEGDQAGPAAGGRAAAAGGVSLPFQLSSTAPAWLASAVAWPFSAYRRWSPRREPPAW
jgi:transcription-repair coupling factor (superfamily II helicase)